MAGNRGSNQYTFVQIVSGGGGTTTPEPILSSIPLSGSLSCINEAAYVISEPGASITITSSSTGLYAAGGLTDSNGKFEFTISAPGTYTVRASKSGFQDSMISLVAKDCAVPLSLSVKRVLNCQSAGKCQMILKIESNKITDFQVKVSDYMPSNIIKTVTSLLDRLGTVFVSYSYTDSTITIPSSQSISSTFSILVDTHLTSEVPVYNETADRMTFSITNPITDASVDETIIPLPEEARGKDIYSIQYVSADGNIIEITNYVVESDRIIVKQQLDIKK